MVDLTEIEALKASTRGAIRASEGLAAVAMKVDDLAPHADIAAADLDELQRLSLANAIAAQALRGLVESMLRRRGKMAAAAVAESGGEIDE